MTAMGAVETDFECAAMCGYSYLYTFSDTSRGPPPRNCSTALIEFANDVSSAAKGWFATFAVLTFLAGVHLSFLWSEKRNKLHSPLLAK